MNTEKETDVEVVVDVDERKGIKAVALAISISYGASMLNPMCIDCRHAHNNEFSISPAILLMQSPPIAIR